VASLENHLESGRNKIEMEHGLKVAIEHEEEVINSAKKILEFLKGFTAANPETQKQIVSCSNEAVKIIASSEMFIKLLEK
jgi:hypothetical protein